ncbi:glomulin isoform X2 [Kryptolebias marmoratus]|uniref:glomulin isoform X2 n=1 Tax=Kryptolebias marmoratus TaxID=37003 RepID=UPI0007F8EA74|nr:glomulin isoform X2 [Kryptolebias marmoratus]
MMNELIQRWRDAREEDLKLEDYQQFSNMGAACLDEGDGEQLLTFLQNEKNQGIVKSMGCGLLAHLIKEVAQNKRSQDHCQAAITQLTKSCSPETLFRSFLEVTEDIDPGAISETILAVLPHLQTVLLQMDERKGSCVGLALSAIQKQLSRLPVPYTQQQDEADEHSLHRCCSALAAFVQPFVEEVKKKDENSITTAEEEELKTELLKFCMRSLREPLLEAELNQDRKSALWLFAADIIDILLAIKESLSGLLFSTFLRKGILMDGNLSKESTACLAYLLFVQLIGIDSFPAVFSPVFILQCNMEHINQLLSCKKESHLLKGLALFSKSLEKVDNDNLPVGLLDLKSFYNAPQRLRQVLTDCPIRHLRESGLRVFQLLINKLDAEAKHKFFRCMLKTSNHAGVESYIVKNIRNQIQLSMKPGNANKWFLGVKLLPLVGLVLHLPQAAETDLLSNMDKVMESLNLLRFLLFQDKELRNNADMWGELCSIKDLYLKTLRVCISMSRAYYSAELKALKEDQKLKAKESKDAARPIRLIKPITMKHESMSSMSPELQYQELQSALVTFDLMESLVVRIEEITEEKLAKLN